MLSLNEKIKRNPINLKDAIKYINDNKQFILLNHKEFINLCKNIDDVKKFYIIESDGNDFIVEGLDDCSYILDGGLSGSIIVVGDNNCNAVRTGIGIGDAIRVGNGNGLAIRNHISAEQYVNEVQPNEILIDDVSDSKRFFIGNSIRDGIGSGDAVFLSHFAGNSIKIGKGKGSSISSGGGYGLVIDSEKYDNRKTSILKYSKDILTIPEKLLSDKDNLIANVFNYEQFISKANYSQQTDSSNKISINHSFYLEGINENIIIELTNEKINGNLPVNIFIYCISDCSIEVRLNNIRQHITVTRKDDFDGHIILSGKGNGSVIRLGNGNGHSILIGDINGTARRVGKGIGESYKEGNGLGGISNIKG